MSTPKGMVDVTPGVGLFYEIVQAADELEAFIAQNNKPGGGIVMDIDDGGIAAELTRLVTTLQEKLAPYRAAVRNVDARDAARN